MILANWNNVNGKIIENRMKNVEIVPEVIDFVLLHNLIVDDVIRPHLLLKVFWYAPKFGLKSYCGPPVEVWSRDIYDVEGESSFMPIRRIYSKFVESTGVVRNKKVVFVCPVHKKINIV